MPVASNSLSKDAWSVPGAVWLEGAPPDVYLGVEPVQVPNAGAAEAFLRNLQHLFRCFLAEQAQAKTTAALAERTLVLHRIDSQWNAALAENRVLRNQMVSQTQLLREKESAEQLLREKDALLEKIRGAILELRNELGMPASREAYSAKETHTEHRAILELRNELGTPASREAYSTKETQTEHDPSHSWAEHPWNRNKEETRPRVAGMAFLQQQLDNVVQNAMNARDHHVLETTHTQSQTPTTASYHMFPLQSAPSGNVDSALG